MAIAVAPRVGGPPWLSFLLILAWGALIIPDSAQFSATIADAVPPEISGSLMTMQTALGFALTILTAQATPVLVGWLGWPLALGPAMGNAGLCPFLRRVRRRDG